MVETTSEVRPILWIIGIAGAALIAVKCYDYNNDVQRYMSEKNKGAYAVAKICQALLLATVAFNMRYLISMAVLQPVWTSLKKRLL